MTDAQDGTFASRALQPTTVAKVAQATVAGLRKQLDQAIQRCAMKGEREREAERAALVARLGAPRVKRKQKDVPFVPRKD